MKNDKCQWPKCSLPYEIIYLGVSLCEEHWEKSCKMSQQKIYKMFKIKKRDKCDCKGY